MMKRATGMVLFSFFIGLLVYAQTDEIWNDSDVEPENSLEVNISKTKAELATWIENIQVPSGHKLIAGYVQSVFREAVDSARVMLFIDDELEDSSITQNGTFYFTIKRVGQVVDVRIVDPDYHTADTSFIYPRQQRTMVLFDLEPRYKILLRGRVYAGNIPLEGVDVEITRGADAYHLRTRGCYYDKEDYWNCLYDGMFKLELLADDPGDSITITLEREGMKNMSHQMTFNEYSGEIMDLRMKYESVLPDIPVNNVKLMLAFPFMANSQDWFVDLSYYRLVNEAKWRRLAYGIDANMYISNITETHETFEGLEPSEVDSSYIRAFAGPSIKYWIVAPEKRNFSSYFGGSYTVNFTNKKLIPHVFIGSRVFLDLNKAISLEVRYTEFEMDVANYIFNPYGNAEKYFNTTLCTKIHAALGIQIVF